MAKYRGGDIEEIVCKHAVLGDFRFQAKSNESFTIDPGGLRSNDDSGMITGGGTFIDQINRVRWSVEGPIAVDDQSENEFKGLRDLAQSEELGTWTVSHINGTVWRGQGKPVGDLQSDTNTAQMTLKISGSGVLETI